MGVVSCLTCVMLVSWSMSGSSFFLWCIQTQTVMTAAVPSTIIDLAASIIRLTYRTTRVLYVKIQPNVRRESGITVSCYDALISGMMLTGENGSIRKEITVPLRPSQVPHGPGRGLIRAAVMRDRSICLVQGTGRCTFDLIFSWQW